MNKTYLAITISTAIALVGCNNSQPLRTEIAVSHPINVYSSDELNAGTSRTRRNELACTVATTDGVNPAPRGVDGLMPDSANFGYADLYGDGTIETITGFVDEMKKTSIPGNQERSRSPSQYMFFSPDPTFVAPADTKFLQARNIIPSDFNGDGIDDVVFVQSGADYKPYTSMVTKVMLSGPTGYKMTTLPNSLSNSYGGAVGDINNDGNLDIVTTPDKNHSIVAYLGDGTGKFKRTKLIGGTSRRHYFNIQLWDIDGDGHLDMIADGHKVKTTIFWGSNGKFSQASATELKGPLGVMSDATFGDFNGDGKLEIVTVDSLKHPNKDSWYNGFAVQSYTVTGRDVNAPYTLHIYDESEGQGKGSARSWLPYISGCDLKNDGDLDLVAINNSYQLTEEWTGMGKFVLENQGNGTFTKYIFREKNMSVAGFPPRYFELAKEIGISVNTYVPAQIYFKGANPQDYTCTLCNSRDGVPGKNSLASFEVLN